MNTKRKLNCYIFSNLIVSFLTLNLLTIKVDTTQLVKKTSNNILNKIYEKNNVEVPIASDILISNNNEKTSNVITISNKVLESGKVHEYVKPSYNSLTGNNLVNYALKFIGLKYVSAGNSLATGTDCSGFTSLIYKEFGVALGRTVASQLYSGTYVSKNDLQPGDLIFYSYGTTPSHVAIYIGNGQIIHESTPRDGVKVSTMNIMNYITARRIITENIVVNSPEVVEESNNENQDIVLESDVQETEEVTDSQEVVTEIVEVKTENEVINQEESQEEEVKEINVVESSNIDEENTTELENKEQE